jgi:hypothetical protein
MSWLRSLLREWLGVVSEVKYLDNRIDSTKERLSDAIVRIQTLEREVAEFKQALKAKAQQVRVAPVYVDYETAQVKALEQFKEK